MKSARYVLFVVKFFFLVYMYILCATVFSVNKDVCVKVRLRVRDSVSWVRNSVERFCLSIVIASESNGTGGAFRGKYPVPVKVCPANDKDNS